MSTKSKTLYLWDFAGTLFPEEWDKEKTGVVNFNDYLKFQGLDPAKMSDLEYERHYEPAYRDGLFKLEIAPGFEEVLSWTKNNEAFTTGTPEQTACRAENFLSRGLLDIRPYFKKVNSTFDFAPTNKKTEAMIQNLLKNKIDEGYETIVYTDDKLENCLFFLKIGKRLANLNLRVYHIKNDNRGVRKKKGYLEIGNLRDLMENEKKLNKE